jgi:hypothetical protein
MCFPLRNMSAFLPRIPRFVSIPFRMCLWQVAGVYSRWAGNLALLRHPFDPPVNSMLAVLVVVACLCDGKHLRHSPLAA